MEMDVGNRAATINAQICTLGIITARKFCATKCSRGRLEVIVRNDEINLLVYGQHYLVLRILKLTWVGSNRPTRPRANLPQRI